MNNKQYIFFILLVCQCLLLGFILTFGFICFYFLFSFATFGFSPEPNNKPWTWILDPSSIFLIILYAAWLLFNIYPINIFYKKFLNNIKLSICDFAILCISFFINAFIIGSFIYAYFRNL